MVNNSFLASGGLYEFLGIADYFFLGAAALWGIYCVVLVWMRLTAKRFKNEEQQNAFLEQVEDHLRAGDFNGVEALCEGDQRAVPMMISLAVKNRDLPPEELENWVMDRFQFDVISPLQSSFSWISTLIKASPMLGLLGTVAGMMGAFATLETATAEEPTKQLLADIRMALEHTLIGLLITVTLLFNMAPINTRYREMEELVVFGMNRFFAAFKAAQPKRRMKISS